jgi:hypothetical protein
VAIYGSKLKLFKVLLISPLWFLALGSLCVWPSLFELRSPRGPGFLEVVFVQWKASRLLQNQTKHKQKTKFRVSVVVPMAGGQTKIIPDLPV